MNTDRIKQLLEPAIIRSHTQIKDLKYCIVLHYYTNLISGCICQYNRFSQAISPINPIFNKYIKNKLIYLKCNHNFSKRIIIFNES